MEKISQRVPLHKHLVMHPTRMHAAELAAAGFNARLAVLLTRGLSSMWCTYLFTCIAFVGLLGLLGWLNPFTFLLATWVSQQFIQLTSLSILGAGQLVMGRHAELQADANYHTTNESFADIEMILHHLDEQDTLIKNTTLQIEALLTLLKTQKGE